MTNADPSDADPTDTDPSDADPTDTDSSDTDPSDTDPSDTNPTDADLSAETERRIGSFVRDWLADESLPGASIAVVRGDECVYADGFGSRDLAENEPATADTLYGIGSVTKSVAALAVMQLQEAGELDVEDPVNDYVAIDFPAEITLHHLLSHSSGLPSLGTSEALIARQTGMGELGIPLGDRDDFHAYVESGLEEIAGDPGDRFQYCNSGYSLLGEIVADLTDQSFAEYVDTEILSPLGMDRSTFSAEDYESDHDAATPYILGDGSGDGNGIESPEATDLPVRELSAAPGGLVSSVRELARYLALQKNGGAFDGAQDDEVDGTQLASEASFDRMHEGHIETDLGPYGYGWRRREVAGETVVGHGGSIAVSTAYVGFTPDDEWGVAVLCNGAADPNPKAVADGVFSVLLGDDPEEVPAFARRERVSDLTGSYESYRGVRTAEVSSDGGTLRFEFTDAFGGEGSALIPEDDSLETTEFYQLSESGTRKSVEFEVSEDGTDLFVDRWRLHKVN
jgi:CubicO group peptidase (beta-lactamase class C family)